VAFAARLGQAADQARSDRVGGVDEHHGDGLGDLQQRCCGLAASGEDNVRGREPPVSAACLRAASPIPAQRYSMLTLRPTFQPACCRAL